MVEHPSASCTSGTRARKPQRSKRRGFERNISVDALGGGGAELESVNCGAPTWRMGSHDGRIGG